MTTTERPYFSIVVPCCGVGCYLSEVVDSLVGQDFADWECILAYEESPDDTRAVCEAMTKRDSRVRFVDCGPRSGSPATPRNRAFEQASGEYVIWRVRMRGY
jgi:glycosyltransferase involved in cell wall biosynthesis